MKASGDSRSLYEKFKMYDYVHCNYTSTWVAGLRTTRKQRHTYNNIAERMPLATVTVATISVDLFSSRLDYAWSLDTPVEQSEQVIKTFVQD